MVLNAVDANLGMTKMEIKLSDVGNVVNLATSLKLKEKIVILVIFLTVQDVTKK